MKKTKPPTYIIKDTKGEEVHGTFYEQELQKSKQTIYRIEKVLKKRISPINNQKELYVKWKGYNKNFNSWIPFTSLENGS